MAVPVPQETVRAVSALVEGVRALDGAAIVGPIRRGSNDVRWVRLDGLHVTLRFLGPTLEDKVEAVGGAVRAVAAVSAPFDVRLAGAGAFPSPERPRALWLGVEDGAVGARPASRRGWTASSWPVAGRTTTGRSART